MKGLEKLTSIRLAEVLTQRDSVKTDAITDALYAQDRQGEVFVDVLIDGGHITEWDLAKIVVEHFQLPFIMASSSEIDDETKNAFPRELLFRHRIVPLSKLGDVATVVMPILTPFDALSKLQDDASVEIFPYVGLTSENSRVLGELFPDYAEWVKAEKARREEQQRTQRKRPKQGGAGGNWMDLFDSGDAKVRDSLTRD